MTRLLRTIGPALTLMLVLGAVPALAVDQGVQTSPQAIDALDDNVMWFGEIRELQDSTLEWHEGERVNEGGCSFSLPPLDGSGLKPGEAIEQRQVATNFTTCEILVETGMAAATSKSADPPESEVTTETVSIGSTLADAKASTRSGASQSANYQIRWEDVVNIWVTKTALDMTWDYDWVTVLGSTGTVQYSWRTGTGWSKTSSSSWSSLLSTSHRYFADATYKNTSFCIGTVTNYYDDQYVRGSNTGTRSGGYGATWTTYPAMCPVLHFHTQLTA